MSEIEKLSQRDPRLSAKLRPSNLKQFVGQADAVKLIEVMCRRGSLSDSILFVGPPGMGKTTLAKMTTTHKLWTVLGGSLTKVSEVHWQLLAPKDGDVLFVDEIHSARNAAMEAFYTVMEDGVMTSADWGTTALKDFQIVAATTEPGKMPAPLRDRFGQIIYLDYYTYEEIQKILKRSSRILKMQVGDKHIEDIANRARGIPRIANRLLRRVRDFDDIVTSSVMEEVWGVLKIDPIGLEPLDTRVMEHIKYSFRPVGINTIARAVGLDKDTLEQMVEPYLIRRKLWQIVPGGRMLTDAGREYLID